MASAQKTEIFDANIEKIYQVLTDYESYPDFMDGVSSVEVVSKEGGDIKAKYSLNIIKKFEYTLNHKEVKPTKISWTFDSGDLFKTNNGSWELKKIDENKTEVTYSVDIDFKVMVPGMISKKLVSSNLPSMMKSVCKRAQNL